MARSAPTLVPASETGRLSHAQIWAAIDRLAERYGMTPSGLAKRAGLDATTFNRSKRQTGDGRLRWPSTESLAKILDASGATLSEFIGIGGLDAARSRPAMPLISLAQAGQSGFFDQNGFPVGELWDETTFPNLPDEHAYALEIDESLRPLYRDGDVVIVSPAAPIRRGDRVVLRTIAGELLAGELKRRTQKMVELRSVRPEQADRVLAAESVAWMSRILWASQ
ncbi:MAG TPA: helix-turn-helix transcriptional regulator [Beijerinckiaceae bacterium]|nr:helix-turn-helix transcriptional regulator [Beijerinckiaceae bacterium]